MSEQGFCVTLRGCHQDRACPTGLGSWGLWEVRGGLVQHRGPRRSHVEPPGK